MVKKVLFICVVLALLGSSPLMAHTPLCSCWDEGNGMITCEGGFSDGSSAQGVIMYVKDKNGKTLIKGQMNELSEFSFKKPEQDYRVIFDSGEGHQVEVNGQEIVE